jgi:hypothetical protein
METIKSIKKTLNCVDSNGIKRGWIVYYDDNDKIKEIKNLYDPTAYNGSRPVYNDSQILEKLIKEKKND